MLLKVLKCQQGVVYFSVYGASVAEYQTYSVQVNVSQYRRLYNGEVGWLMRKSNFSLLKPVLDMELTMVVCAYVTLTGLPATAPYVSHSFFLIDYNLIRLSLFISLKIRCP